MTNPTTALDPRVVPSGAVGATILQQLTHTERQGPAVATLQRFIGAKEIIITGEYAEFRWAARAKNGANAIKIVLTPLDVYEVTFLSKRAGKVTVKGEFSNVYAENLKGLFEHQTGLYLSLR